MKFSSFSSQSCTTPRLNPHRRKISSNLPPTMPSTAAFVTRAFTPLVRRHTRHTLICSTSSTTTRKYHPLEPLKSVTNPRVKFARSLLQRKHREESGKVLLEGHRLVLDAVNAGIELEEMYYTVGASSRSTSLIPAFEACLKHPVPVTDKVMVSMSDTVSPQVCLCSSRHALRNVCELTLWA